MQNERTDFDKFLKEQVADAKPPSQKWLNDHADDKDDDKDDDDAADPSSFVEVGAPDSFADIDAKLKALEEKTKAELAKLQSDTAAPSSLAQTDVPINPLKASSELR